MSLPRDNVMWESENGTWNLGFYLILDDEDEEDPEYNYDAFEWVTTGHSDQDAAYQQWKGPNPGGHDVYPYTEDNAARCAKFDAMAERFKRERGRNTARR